MTTTLADKIEQAWKELLPTFDKEYYRLNHQDSDYAENVSHGIFNELVLLNIIAENEYTVAFHYVLAQKQKWLKDANDFFADYIPKRIESMWPHLIDGFDKNYIIQCLNDTEGEEKFAGSVFEAVFDKWTFGDFDKQYSEEELLEAQSYILSHKEKWLKAAKEYNKL